MYRCKLRLNTLFEIKIFKFKHFKKIKLLNNNNINKKKLKKNIK